MLFGVNKHPAIVILYRNFYNYLEAWIDSSIISLIGHFCIPFSPWGVTWAYLGIVYNFNEVLYRDRLNRKTTGSPQSWFRRFSGNYWKSVEIQNSGVISEHFLDDKRKFKCLNFGPFKIPLPDLLDRLFSD